MRGSGYCPHCRRHLLVPVTEGHVVLGACVHCGGLWFDSGELAKVIDSSVGRTTRTQDELSGFSLEDPTPTAMRCPACEESLLRYTLAEMGRVEVDLCEHCQGVWLDEGELAQLQSARAQDIIDRKTNWRSWLFQFLLNLPVEFNLKPRRFPLVTVALVVLNISVMLALIATDELSAVAHHWGIIPREAFGGHWAVTTLSYAFIHSGLLHLLGNVYFLYILGDNVEDLLGHVGFTVFYLLLAVVAGLVHTLVAADPATPMIGASGAISGVMAAYAVFFRHARLTFMIIVWQLKLRAPTYILLWLLINVIGMAFGAGNVAWDAHLAGFAAGLLAALALDRRILRKHPFLPLLRRNPRSELELLGRRKVA